MINLITGLPGNGKTLYAIAYIKEFSARENRPVFYAGINDLTLPWTPIDPEKWFDAPAGAIIVIDECQTVFRPRATGKEPPDYVARLETHRHNGHDLFLITQHPLLADTALRRLTGRHLHIVRKWGTQAATVHEWPQAETSCEKPAGRKNSIKHAFKFPKNVFGLYKSAELHTVKRQIPARVWGLGVVILCLGLLGTYIVRSMQAKIKPEEKNASPLMVKGSPGTSSQGEKMKVSYHNAMDDAKQFVFERTSRVAGLPHTEPRYDEVTKPTTAPVPVACVASAHACKCYSQQATVITVPAALCRDIVANGFFVDFDDKGGKHNQEHDRDRNGIVARADGVPLSRVQQSDKSAVSVLPYAGESRLGGNASSEVKNGSKT
ncbi:MAG TPA: zonular occludens toxin domain-containing protein [Burkholderiaceae bacterium]|nr:zonular occludens toxin domain-containing protein [Burkholderiaceae bacterium]